MCQTFIFTVGPLQGNVYYVDPPVGWGSTYCFTAVGVGVLVGVTSITKAPPAQICLVGMFFVPQVIGF